MLRSHSVFALALALGMTFCSGCVTVTKEDNKIVSTETDYSATRLETLGREAKRYPKRADLHYEIAQIHFQQGDFHESASALERAIALAPDVSRYHYDLGRVHLRSADYAQAETAFREAVRLSGDRYTGPRAALGYVLAVQKKFGEALEMFEQCIELEPQNAEYYYYLGSIHDIEGRRNDAIRYFQEYLNRGGAKYRRKVVFLLEKLGVDVDRSSIVESERSSSEVPEEADGLGDLEVGPVSRATPSPIPETH